MFNDILRCILSISIILFNIFSISVNNPPEFKKSSVNSYLFSNSSIFVIGFKIRYLSNRFPIAVDVF